MRVVAVRIMLVMRVAMVVIAQQASRLPMMHRIVVVRLVVVRVPVMPVLVLRRVVGMTLGAVELGGVHLRRLLAERHDERELAVIDVGAVQQRGVLRQVAHHDVHRHVPVARRHGVLAEHLRVGRDVLAEADGLTLVQIKLQRVCVAQHQREAQNYRRLTHRSDGNNESVLTRRRDGVGGVCGAPRQLALPRRYYERGRR